MKEQGKSNLLLLMEKQFMLVQHVTETHLLQSYLLLLLAPCFEPYFALVKSDLQLSMLLKNSQVVAGSVIA